jgi:hypothetical protein
MSERSSYLRDQAAKSMRHAEVMSDPFAQAELRRLASEFVVCALEIDSKKAAPVGCSPLTVGCLSR